MGTLGFEDSDVKSLLLLNTGQYLDIETDLRHSPLIISESGCITNTKAVSTKRDNTRPTCVTRNTEPDSEDAERYKSACMRFSYLAQDRLDLAETAQLSAQRMSDPREFDFVHLKRAARYLVGKHKAALRFRRKKHVDKTSLRGQRF